MNAEKLKQLQEQVRIGGKGTARRKKKVIHHVATTDDKKLQISLKKLGLNTIPGIEEVNLIREAGDVIHFNNPKVQGSLSANTFSVSGHAEVKSITELFPSILSQLGVDQLKNLRKIISTLPDDEGAEEGKDNSEMRKHSAMDLEDEEDVPTLVQNFDEPSKDEYPVQASS